MLDNKIPNTIYHIADNAHQTTCKPIVFYMKVTCTSFVPVDLIVF